MTFFDKINLKKLTFSAGSSCFIREKTAKVYKYKAKSMVFLKNQRLKNKKAVIYNITVQNALKSSKTTLFIIIYKKVKNFYAKKRKNAHFRRIIKEKG